jgi:hypothetical protein
MKKQLSLFLGVFLFLAIGMHFKEWLSHPVEHLMALPSAGAYGIGVFHPLVFTLIVYLVLVSFMALGGVVKRIFTR